tara:strand:+ start:804 stop:1145 length:342 start_codon:yes stop_codon:yes gene_type:complete
MSTFNQTAISEYYTELGLLEKREDEGELDMEDFEIELHKLLMYQLQEYFGGKYTELNNKSLRIASHKQGTVWNSKSDFSFVVCRTSTSFGNDFTIQYNEDIEDAINYIKETVK